MGFREMLSSVFHFPAGITIDSIEPSVNELVMRAACDFPSMPCPECHQLSACIHSRYQRLVADLPCAGRNVILALVERQINRLKGVKRQMDGRAHFDLLRLRFLRAC